MATLTASRSLSPLSTLAVLFRALGSVLIHMSQATPCGRALDQLNATSDEELLARGTTRMAEIRRILGSRLYS